MKLDFKCLKCGCNKYYVKSTLLPEKSEGLKIKMGMYYLKSCANCGFTEIYSAEVLNQEKEEKKEEVLEPKLEG